MKILLDSHALVWYLTGNPRCSQRACDAIEATGARVSVSSVSAWEIATKVRVGRWPDAAGISPRIAAILVANGYEALAVTIEHAQLAGSFPVSHGDPFDRMLAAQAMIEDLLLVTADHAFRNFDVRVLW